MSSTQNIDASASVYTRFGLHLYDFWVLLVSNAFAWRCSTRSILLPYYHKHIADSSRHLEIGVGTGYYPASSVLRLAKVQKITLLDLNPHTLAHAKQRLQRAGYKGEIQPLVYNVFHPVPEDMRGAYDSIAMYYLFHCLPGSFPSKAGDVFQAVSPALAPEGVLFGATILGQSAQHNWFGTRLITLYNKKGIFGNMRDSEEGLKKALEVAFEEYEVKVIGVVALFAARKPRVAAA